MDVDTKTKIDHLSLIGTKSDHFFFLETKVITLKLKYENISSNSS